MTFDLELPCIPDSVGRARDAVARLEATLTDRRLGDLRLLVSEVVTNAVRHAGLDPAETIKLRFDTRDDRLRVEVADHGVGFEADGPTPEINRAGGWGLYLVEQLAERWGIDQDAPPTDDRTLVWFELDLR